MEQPYNPYAASASANEASTSGIQPSHSKAAAKSSGRAASEDDGPKPKRQRISTACLNCRQKKAKCDGGKPCTTCEQAKAGSSCTYPPASKRFNAVYVEQLEKYVRELNSTAPNASVSSHGALPFGTTIHLRDQPPPPTGTDRGSIFHSENIFHFPKQGPGGRGLSDESGLSKNEPEDVPLQGLATPASASQNLPAMTLPRQQSVQALQREQPFATDYRSVGLKSSTQDNARGLPATTTGPLKEIEADDVEGASTLLTLVSSPIIMRNFPDSSTSTLVQEVENATRRLTGLTMQGRFKLGDDVNTPKTTSSRHSKPSNMDQENPHLFNFNRKPQEMYSLPHRSLSDALVRRYKESVHPIFRILHWPTFIRQYEETFQSGQPPDKHWLGLLNQVYAIACQLGGTGIPADEEFDYGVRFYQRSLAIMFPLVLHADSLLALQCVLLMGQYLQSINQPTLCWNTVGHAVRFAQIQGLHLSSTYANMTPIEAESGRRAWAGVVVLEATTAATLGLPPALSACQCRKVKVEAVDSERGDSDISAHGVSPSAYFALDYSLNQIALQILRDLYTSPDDPEDVEATPRSSNNMLAQKVLSLSKQVDDWESKLPAAFREPQHFDALNDESRYQANLIQTRLLNTRQLVHRALLSRLCQRHEPGDAAAMSPFERLVARSSGRTCCSAAVRLIERIVGGIVGPRNGFWWYQMYYVYSACFVILAGFLVDLENTDTPLTCIEDVERAAAAVAAARRFFGDDLGSGDSILPLLSSAVGKSTAQSCHRNIVRIGAILAKVPGNDRGGETPRRGNMRASLRRALHDADNNDSHDEEDDPLAGLDLSALGSQSMPSLSNGSGGNGVPMDFFEQISSTTFPGPSRQASREGSRVPTEQSALWPWLEQQIGGTSGPLSSTNMLDLDNLPPAFTTFDHQNSMSTDPLMSISWSSHPLFPLGP